MNEKERLLQTLVGVYTYYDKELTEFACNVWIEDMRPYPVELVEQAFARHRRDPQRGQFLPKSADVIQQIKGERGDEAQVAWLKVMEVARAGGVGGKDLSSPTLDALRSIGGISVVQRCNEAETGFLQKRFVDAFVTYSKREDEAPLLEAPGVAEMLEDARKQLSADKRFGAWAARSQE